jgi:hypothetical protein
MKDALEDTKLLHQTGFELMVHNCDRLVVNCDGNFGGDGKDLGYGLLCTGLNSWMRSSAIPRPPLSALHLKSHTLISGLCRMSSVSVLTNSLKL